MNFIYNLVRVSFFTFLDVSGILLGVFLFGLGLAMLNGLRMPEFIGWLLLVIGAGAFLLHIGHYFNLKYMRWLFGSDYFLRK